MIASNLVEELNAIAQNLRLATVRVRGRRDSMGSGVIWNADGVIITNAHVVSDRKVSIELSDGRVLPAAAIAKNIQRDLVALKIDASDLIPANIGNSDNLRVGELAIAVGNPAGLMGVVTTGIIHSLGAIDPSRRNWIKADVQLAPGNSGGPLANVKGEVIGINTAIVQGRGLAIPSNVVQKFLTAGSDRPYLGVTLQSAIVPLHRRRAYGLLITNVESDSPAENAKLQIGDVIVGVRGIPFQTPHELLEILENSNEGDGLKLDILRGGKLLVADVVLWNRDSSSEAA